MSVGECQCVHECAFVVRVGPLSAAESSFPFLPTARWTGSLLALQGTSLPCLAWSLCTTGVREVLGAIPASPGCGIISLSLCAFLSIRGAASTGHAWFIAQAHSSSPAPRTLPDAAGLGSEREVDGRWNKYLHIKESASVLSLLAQPIRMVFQDKVVSNYGKGAGVWRPHRDCHWNRVARSSW